MSVNPLKRVLTEIARLDGVKGVLVISRDGFLIDSVIPTAGVNAEALSAMVTTTFTAAYKLAEEFQLGDLSLLTAEYSNATALGAPVGDAYLVVLADRGATLGRIRYEIQKQRDRVKAAL